ncbi:hypothetical protein TIFTF001_006760 [Ficus carica]|uniref:AB hydrolase-1 domain-containing protein n=1 Tax=Ficus carica TaxID=3494 RepID=A0AA88D044_FICCA|nr:hypothetical protein TIFTF001_006760 [Ficus carica]
MVNLMKVVNPLVESLLKFYGLRAQTIEIEPGTVIHFWAPTSVTKNQTNRQTKPATTAKLKKPALLLLHGFGATGVLTWLFQVAAFSGKYAVFVPDLLFFGGSTTDSTNRSPAFQAECLTKGLKLLGVESCAVVGCSYGGIVGSKMALLEPNFVKCLVLSNSNLALTESQSEEAFERVGIRSWPELLLPDTVEGLKRLLRVIVYKQPWFPDWAYKHFLEVCFRLCASEYLFIQIA